MFARTFGPTTFPIITASPSSLSTTDLVPPWDAELIKNVTQTVGKGVVNGQSPGEWCGLGFFLIKKIDGLEFHALYFCKVIVYLIF